MSAATIAVPRPERLPVWLKATHGLGSIAYGVKDNGFSTFLLAGLSAVATLFVAAAALAFDVCT